jgi:hypothetical protein
MVCVCNELQHGRCDDLGLKVRHEKLHLVSLWFGTCGRGAQPTCQAPAATERARPIVDPVRKMTASTSFTNMLRRPTSTDIIHAHGEQKATEIFCHSVTDSQLSVRAGGILLPHLNSDSRNPTRSYYGGIESGVRGVMAKMAFRHSLRGGGVKEGLLRCSAGSESPLLSDP